MAELFLICYILFHLDVTELFHYTQSSRARISVSGTIAYVHIVPMTCIKYMLMRLLEMCPQVCFLCVLFVKLKNG